MNFSWVVLFVVLVEVLARLEILVLVYKVRDFVFLEELHQKGLLLHLLLEHIHRLDVLHLENLIVFYVVDVVSDIDLEAFFVLVLVCAVPAESAKTNLIRILLSDSLKLFINIFDDVFEIHNHFPQLNTVQVILLLFQEE